MAILPEQSALLGQRLRHGDKETNFSRFEKGFEENCWRFRCESCADRVWDRWQLGCEGAGIGEVSWTAADAYLQPQHCSQADVRSGEGGSGFGSVDREHR